ncbi:MAG TPA: methyltransferase domain-containing protein [Ktedonobacteraceae bacterium]|nr:methyltransferase domain-containing protein [Ktedonobacteraceae bacterium]
MQHYLLDMLACPICHNSLTWNITDQQADRIEAAEAHCTGCHSIYPVREGIGLFLTPDLPRNDLWEQAGSHLSLYLHEHPDIERQLMDALVDILAPADQFFRALMLEERGEYAQAKVVAELASQGIYTPEYRACAARQIDYLVEQLLETGDPIVDLASGRGGLLEVLARRLQCPIVATDFSPRVLRRNRRWLEMLGLYDRVSLLAFDARRTPFKNGTVKTLTTYLGLPNIEDAGRLLHELRRIVAGKLLAISYFLPENDRAENNARYSPLLFRDEALERCREAGWQVELANVCKGLARPTPSGVLLEGAQIDGVPEVETVLEWGVLVAQ